MGIDDSGPFRQKEFAQIRDLQFVVTPDPEHPTLTFFVKGTDQEKRLQAILDSEVCDAEKERIVVEHDLGEKEDISRFTIPDTYYSNMILHGAQPISLSFHPTVNGNYATVLPYGDKEIRKLQAVLIASDLGKHSEIIKVSAKEEESFAEDKTYQAIEFSANEDDVEIDSEGGQTIVGYEIILPKLYPLDDKLSLRIENSHTQYHMRALLLKAGVPEQDIITQPKLSNDIDGSGDIIGYETTVPKEFQEKLKAVGFQISRIARSHSQGIIGR